MLRLGLLEKVWPPERVMVGLQVSKGIQQELLGSEGKVDVVFTRGGAQNAKDIVKSLVRLRKNR